MSIKLERAILLVIDIVVITAALFLAFLLRFGMNVPSGYFKEFLLLVPLAVLVKTPVFYYLGFYDQLWRYASLKEGLRLLRGISIASLLLLAALFFTQFTSVPRGVFGIDWLMTLCFVGGSRFAIRATYDLLSAATSKVKDVAQKRVIIVGAGEAGSLLIKQLQQHPENGYKPVALLDDNPSKKGLMIHGIKVIGSSQVVPSVIASHSVDEIILAMPSATSQERSRIALRCREIGIPCRTVPDIVELINGNVSLSQIRNIDPKELLGRKETHISFKNTVNQYKGKTILVTGAAGSIGSEICRQAIDLAPEKVIAADISENGLYHLEEEMIPRLNGSRVAFEARVMDIRDECAVDRLFEFYKPAIVFHAAAYKHVPMMERHPIEAMRNNFLGTQIVADVADRHNSERFTLISTDKAVKPASIMGVSKQLAEKSIKVAANRETNTRFMAVRFGNVLGSNGSVIPKFKRQIREGAAITVTHPDMTRYFMTIQEAVYLVIQATAMGKGGEIFVLDMGEPVRILDLAHSIIKLSGFEPGKDIPIKFTGLRPGEKLYEELFTEDEMVNKTRHPKIFKVASELNEEMIAGFLSEMENAVMEGDDRRFTDILSRSCIGRAA